MVEPRSTQAHRSGRLGKYMTIQSVQSMHKKSNFQIQCKVCVVVCQRHVMRISRDHKEEAGFYQPMFTVYNLGLRLYFVYWVPSTMPSERMETMQALLDWSPAGHRSRGRSSKEAAARRSRNSMGFWHGPRSRLLRAATKDRDLLRQPYVRLRVLRVHEWVSVWLGELVCKRAVCLTVTWSYILLGLWVVSSQTRHFCAFQPFEFGRVT